MTADDERAARGRAHEILGAALACGPDLDRDADHSHACDRLTASELAHARELAALLARAEAAEAALARLRYSHILPSMCPSELCFHAIDGCLASRFHEHAIDQVKQIDAALTTSRPATQEGGAE